MVKMKLYDESENIINTNGDIIAAAVEKPGPDEGVIHLELERIPFTMMDIKGSLLKDVYKHQVALLNLGSSDVSYALKANYPFYIEQKDN